jgi:hypothetical protein
MRPQMKTIKYKIGQIVKSTNGFPNFTLCEYLDAIRDLMDRRLSAEELQLIKKHKMNVDKLIIEVTKEVTEGLF